MKKILLAFFLTLAAPIILLAQSEKEFESKSKAVKYFSSNGLYAIKESYDLPKVRNIKNQVVIITDVATGNKIGYLRIGSYNRTGTVDYEELDACIQSLQHMKKFLLPTAPQVYTEAFYKTLDGVEFGVYYDNNKWTAVFDPTPYREGSQLTFNPGNIESFINIMVTAKQIITEKTKHAKSLQ